MLLFGRLQRLVGLGDLRLGGRLVVGECRQCIELLAERATPLEQDDVGLQVLVATRER